MKIDQHTELYGVIGSPIGHSLSPTMLDAAFRAIGRNAVYLAFEAKDVNGCVQGMEAPRPVMARAVKQALNKKR